MRYDLSSEYVDAQAEAELLQAIATDRALFWELDLPAAAFHTYGEAYKALADAIEAEQPSPGLDLSDPGEDATRRPPATLTAEEKARSQQAFLERRQLWGLDQPAGPFNTHEEAYEALAEAAQAGQPSPELDLPEPAEDATRCPPATLAAELKDLWQRRQVAELQQDIAGAVGNRETPAAEIVSALVEQAAGIEASLHTDGVGRLCYPADLVPEVLQQARKAREAHQATGSHITGVTTGLQKLDDILGGLPAGLTILSGGPGVGKTTLALQIAIAAAEAGTPALYISFENSPANLTTKGICAVGGLDSKKVRRGQLPVEQLQAAAEQYRAKAERLAIIAGHPELTRGQLRGRARRLMNRFGAERCLIVVDYLQLYAKAAADLRGMREVRAKVEAMGADLQALASRLDSPVLALSSQSRGAGYGSGGSTNLDTLKESGDLEYGADAVVFLTESPDRMASAPARAVLLAISKNRHGTTGQLPLIFRPDLGRLRPEGQHTYPRAPGRGDGAGTPF